MVYFPAYRCLKIIRRPRHTHEVDKTLFGRDISDLSFGMTCRVVLIPNLACWVTCERPSLLRQSEIVSKVRLTMIRLPKASFSNNDEFQNNMTVEDAPFQEILCQNFFSSDNTGLSRLSNPTACQPFLSPGCCMGSYSRGQRFSRNGPFHLHVHHRKLRFTADLSPKAEHYV